MSLNNRCVAWIVPIMAVAAIATAQAAAPQCTAAGAAVGLAFHGPAVPPGTAVSMSTGMTEHQMIAQLRATGFSPTQADRIAQALETALLRLQTNPRASNARLAAGSAYPATVMFRRACNGRG